MAENQGGEATAPSQPEAVAECVNVDEVMALGADRLPPEVSSYVLAASGDEETARDNLEAFRRRRLRPRILTGLDDLSTETSVLGTDVAMPLGIAPMAEHALAHPDAELAMCRAAAEAGVPMCVSTASSVPLDRVAGVAAEADAPWWFQLYAGADREATTSLVRRAVGGGCAAVVLTVDVAVVGYRDRERITRRSLPDSPYYDGHWGHLAPEFDVTTIGFRNSWSDLEWIREACGDCPLVLKGVLTAEDATLAVSHGASAVWVSNHGGRQLDRSPATLDVLREVVEAVAGTTGPDGSGRPVEVYLDGGIRRGIDVVTALAMGARCVFVGRPAMLGLAAEGQAGVAAVLAILRRELHMAMTLIGVARPELLDASFVLDPPPSR